MKKRLALFDLGTNTFNFLVCDVENGAFQKVYETKIPVRLGQGGLVNNKMLPEAMERGIMALQSAMQEVTQLGCDEIVAIGTAALRAAKNADDFIIQVKQNLGLNIEIIDGNREAELIYKGVRQSGLLGDDTDLIMDIGGGSIEFILGNNEKPTHLFSFNAGVAKLLRRFGPTDPISKDDITAIKEWLDIEFDDLHKAVEAIKPKRLIGSSGSFDSVRDMIIANEKLEVKLEGHVVPRKHFDSVYKTITAKNKAERYKVPGLVPMRVDYIVIAVILMDFILEKYNFDAFTQSDYSIKEGLLSENL